MTYENSLKHDFVEFMFDYDYYDMADSMSSDDMEEEIDRMAAILDIFNIREELSQILEGLTLDLMAVGYNKWLNELKNRCEDLIRRCEEV